MIPEKAALPRYFIWSVSNFSGPVIVCKNHENKSLTKIYTLMVYIYIIIIVYKIVPYSLNTWALNIIMQILVLYL